MLNKYLTQVQEHDRLSSNKLIPSDALCYIRLLQFEDFCSLVEDLIEKTRKTEKEILQAIKLTASLDKNFNLIFDAVQYIIEVNTKEI